MILLKCVYAKTQNLSNKTEIHLKTFGIVVMAMDLNLNHDTAQETTSVILL